MNGMVGFINGRRYACARWRRLAPFFARGLWPLPELLSKPFPRTIKPLQIAKQNRSKINL
jgi:hypothetical protein